MAGDVVQVDLLIVGRGPAGIACALQAHRDGLRTLLVGDEPPGGLVRAARRIDNLPGSPATPGNVLAERMARQVEDAGVLTRQATIASLARTACGFAAAVADGSIVQARAVCLATGTRPRPWPLVPGDGVVRDARAFPADLDGRCVVVVGGGEAALDTALSARDRGAAVVVLARGAALRGARGLIDEVRRAGIDVRLGARVDHVAGGPGGWTIGVDGGGDVAADVLAACLGRVPRDELWRGLAAESPEAAVVQPRIPGVFAAGDWIRGRERYVATALGDGQRAALAAAAWLEGRT